LLKIPHATLVTNIEIMDGKAKVHRELEEGLNEVVEVQLPAVLTIQTGINQPRYVSIMGVRKASTKEIQTLGIKELGSTADEVGEIGSRTRIQRLFLPPVTKEAQILEGSPEVAATKLAQILKEKGV
jgi:electron transfer flavoprotein beta subunit